MVDSTSIFITLLAVKTITLLYLTDNPFKYDLWSPTELRPLQDKSKVSFI